MADQQVVKDALKEIFSGIDKLKRALPSKEFTIDGRLVGDIGEALVQRDYDVTLYEQIVPRHDGVTSNGRRVQIKATFKESLTFRTVPDYYLGIKIYADGTYKEIYNGSSDQIKEKYGHRKGFGVKLLSFPNSVLSELSRNISERDRIATR